MNSKIKFEKSTGNVFADLGVADAEDLQARGMVGYHVVELLKKKNIKQKEIAEILSIKQAEVSHLLNGHFSRFSVEKLFDFLMKMDQKVTIQISPRTHGEAFQDVISA